MKVQTTQETIDEIKKVLESQTENPGSVRIFVAGHGCSGPSLGLALDAAKETDLQDTSNEVTFVMDQGLFEQLGEVKVEYVGNGYFVSPVNQVESGCSGCGGGCH